MLNEVVKRMPVYLLNSVNPYRLEGQKTAAIELLEQLSGIRPITSLFLAATSETRRHWARLCWK